MSDGPFRRRRTVLTACAPGAASLAGSGNPLSDSGDSGSNGTSDDETNDTMGDETTSTNTNGTTGNESSGGTGESSTIQLGGESQGWTGQEPEAISGETNPTLELQVGETYEIVWENLDGAEHELILVDENGEEVEASDESESEGETVSLEFTAGEELAEYFCEYHPDAMRGEIEVTGGEGR